MTQAARPLLVVGLGNPILSDDGIGWRVAAVVREWLAKHELHDCGVEVKEVAVGGLSLAEMLAGYERAIIVDAIMTGQGVPGAVYHFELADLPGTLNTASAHDTNLATALRALRRFGADVPQDDAIHIVAVEAQDVWTFSERCSPPVEAAIPVAAQLVKELILQA